MAVSGFALPAEGGVEWVSGKAIPVGGPDRRGPLSVGVVNRPLGVASVTGAQAPDLFVASNRHSAIRGLFLYPWRDTAPTGAPVFGPRLTVKHPGPGDLPPAGTIFQTADGVVHGWWLKGKSVVRTVYDKTRRAFVATEAPSLEFEGLPRAPGYIAVDVHPDGSAQIALGIHDGTPGRPREVSARSDAYRPYDGAGVWRGGWPYAFLHHAYVADFRSATRAETALASTTRREGLLHYGNLAFVNLGPSREHDLVAGSRFGNLLYYRRDSAADRPFEPKRFLVGRDGIALRHPTISPTPIAYPRTDGAITDLIASGEGALYFYRFTGRIDSRGIPVFKDPVPVLERNADVYAGSLPVVSVVDFDGDGADDIVAGNSEGRVLFFRNDGTNRGPALLPGAAIEAGGRPIHVQQGYGGIQGPGEARWGYVCPTVADWNGDGLPDILMSGATAEHVVYLNRGSRTKPVLDAGRPLYLDGFNLHGTWRVQPGVARLGDRMAYVALDDDDAFHLYWRLDDFNVVDGGKLELADGPVITANFLRAGGTGRLKLVLSDWDRDGLVDILVGTPRHGSVPNPETGLPQSLGLPGSAVLFMKNVGTNAAPAFAFPALMAFKGEPLFLGQHACSPAVADFGRADGPDLIVGIEDGRFLFYERSDLSWVAPSTRSAASRPRR